MVLNATFNNISAISWRSVLFVEEPGVYKEDSVMMSYCGKQNEKSLRWYHTLQGDNSLKSVERFDHMMFVCRFQASR
jgi:hypothetical protein